MLKIKGNLKIKTKDSEWPRDTGETEGSGGRGWKAGCLSGVNCHGLTEFSRAAVIYTLWV